MSIVALNERGRRHWQESVKLWIGPKPYGPQRISMALLRLEDSLRVERIHHTRSTLKRLIAGGWLSSPPNGGPRYQFSLKRRFTNKKYLGFASGAEKCRTRNPGFS